MNELLPVLLVAVGCAGVQANGTADAGASEWDAGQADAGQCYPATGSAPECSALQLCVMQTPRIEVDPSNCGAGQCQWHFAENSGDTLTFENADGWLFLRFHSGSHTGVPDRATFEGAFEHVNFYAKLVPGQRDGAI